MLHRLARLIAATVVGLSVINMACSESQPLSPTPAHTTQSPAPVPVVGVRYVNPDGGPTTGDLVVRINGYGFQAGATVMFGDSAARVIGVTASVITVRTPAHPAGAADILVTNPDGQIARLSSGYRYGGFSVTARPTVVTTGGELTVSFVAPEGRNCLGGGDWIAIYKVGDPDNTGASNGHSDLWYDHLCGAASGSRTLVAPDQPGDYEFRYMVDDTSVARSERVSILAGLSSLTR
jgi:hypothetical protein